jgi:hypothetical protein
LQFYQRFGLKSDSSRQSCERLSQVETLIHRFVLISHDQPTVVI